MALAHGARGQRRVGLARRADAGHLLVADAEQPAAGLARVDDGAAQEVGRSAGDGEQGGRYQPSRRRLGDGDRLAPLLEAVGDRFGEGNERLHEGAPRLGHPGRLGNEDMAGE